MQVRRLFRLIENGIATLMDLRPHKPTAHETALSARLATDLRAIVESGDTGAGSDFWRNTCQALATLAAEDDPSFFMRWEPIRATMVHGATPSIIAAWWKFRHSPEWRTIWAPALWHKQYGHPPPFPPMPATNAVAIEHARHLCSFRQAAGEWFHDVDCIVEFGGGYGSMCRLIYAMGFRGTYIIFDLPHVLALQRYYLALHGIETEMKVAAQNSRVLLLSDLDDVLRFIDESPLRLSAISTWALSEMPLSLRQRIELILQRSCCRRILLSYQARFEGIDNLDYFKAFASRTGGSFAWTHMPVEPEPRPGSPYDSHYLFGLRQ